MDISTTADEMHLDADNGKNLQIEDRLIITEGKWIKTAKILDEIWIEGQAVTAPEAFVSKLKRSELKADLFTFAQSLPDADPKFSYPVEWDNIAVAATKDFSAWWDSLPQESRKNVRRAERRGLVVKCVEFSDELVRGIKEIYDETPIRQGRRFWHYGKDLATVKRENATYLPRSQFIAAYHNDELAGFIKMVYVGPTARIMQILAKNRHFDKRPVNAMLAKAVEVCSKRPVAHLIYSQYVYDGIPDSPVTEFKRRNGFHQVLLPRYYVPLSFKGRLAIATNLHRGLKARVPGSVLSNLRRLRESFYKKTVLRSAAGEGSADSAATSKSSVEEPVAGK